jgi:WD40 repeat protein/tRNA A-37 threonylcarbamoyl transferase component Bud32
MTALPDVRELLRQANGLDVAQVVDALQHDQIQRWQQGQRVPAETYLQLLTSAHGENGDATEQALDLVYAEFLLRQQQGESPTVDEYKWRFPQYAAQLGMLAELERELEFDEIADASTKNLTNGKPSQVRGPIDAPEIRGYTVLEEIGRGGTGVVYKAIQDRLNRTVALKVIRVDDEESQSRFRIEAEAVARLQHSNIVQIYEVGEVDERRRSYMALEFVAGGSLAQRLAGQPGPIREAAELAETIARAVHFAHQHGILHRDLKPGNILLTGVRDQESVVSRQATLTPDSYLLTPKVADFGLAKRLEDLDSSQTRTGSIIGTPSYMAPEQAEGRTRDIGVATDVYALGAILYEMLTGRPPFKGATPLETLETVRTREPVPPGKIRTGVPRDLETICLKCLRKEAANRYASADALADDLHRFLSGQPIQARRVSAAGRLAMWAKRHPALSTTFAISLLVIGTIAVMSYMRVIHERDRYRTEHDRAVAHLYQSLVGEARAIRLARAPGYREEALARLQQAMALDTPAHDLFELRQEAVACLGDFVGLEPTTWKDIPDKNYAVALAVHPRGTEVALGMYDGAISIRRRETGEQLALLQGHKSGVYAIVFDSAGDRMFSADDSGAINQWSKRSGKWSVDRTLTIAKSGRPNHVHAVSLALSPDDRRLFACSRSTTDVHVWDLTTANEEKAFATPRKETLYRVTLSRDGKWLAAAIDPAAGSDVVIWDVAKRLIINRFAPAMGPINDVVFSPGGRHLACACQDGVAVFDTPDFRSRLFVRGDRPNAVTFSPDERLLVIPAEEYGLVRLWSVRANREIAVLKHDNEPHSVAFTPDGASLIGVGASLVCVWNLRGTGEKLVMPGHSGSVMSVRINRTGDRLFSAGADGFVRIVDPRSGRLLGQLKLPHPCAVDVTTDGNTALTCDDFGRIDRWDVTDPANPRRVRTYEHPLGEDVFCAAISPNGEHIAATGPKGVVIWAGDAPQPVHCSDLACISLTFTPDSRRLIWNGTGSDKVFVRDITSGTQKSFSVEGAPAAALPVFPDNRRIMRLNNRKEITVIDVDTGENRATFGRVDFGGQGTFFMGHASALSGDSTLAAFQAPSVPIWDVERQTMLFAVPTAQTLPTTLTWGANRDMLAIGSRDGEVVVWHIPILREQLRKIGLDW